VDIKGLLQPQTLLVKGRELALPLAFICSLLIIIVPLSPWLMDLFLSLNISLAVIVLLTTIYVTSPMEFSIFPSLLLITTLMRLVLNIATTRLILANAQDGLNAAGGVIAEFGSFVAGSNIVIGIIIFAIIVIIQFMVITKGATRISEVAARFALDGMPGKQMAIDADLSAGIIDEHQAQKRRDELTETADFFGAMDGASKFVRGDAIAGMLITAINIVGGLIIGILQHDMTLANAAEIYTILTIGDGLVSQVPAFFISLASGLLIARSSKERNLSADFITELFTRPKAMVITGSFLFVLMFTRLPSVPLFMIGASCFTIALVTMRKTKDEVATTQKAEEEAEAEKNKPPEERIEDYLKVEQMELELGTHLVRLVDPKRNGDLLVKIQSVRKNIAMELGVILPKVRIRDNLSLDTNQYQVKIGGATIAKGMVHPEMSLAVDLNMNLDAIPGLQTRDPAFDMPAIWIESKDVERAQMMGYVVSEPTSVVVTHLTEVIRRYADELLTRDATQKLLDELREDAPAVVNSLVPEPLPVAVVQQILQNLLREGISIRQLASILEAIGDHVARVRDPLLLTEYARHRLARTICAKLSDADGVLHVVTIDPALADQIQAGMETTEAGLVVRLSPQAIEMLCNLISEEIEKLQTLGLQPVLLVNPSIRPGMRMITQSNLPHLSVVSFNEVTRDTQIDSVGMVELPASPQAGDEAPQ